MLPEIKEIKDNSGHTGYIYVCPRCRKKGNLEASASAAIYLLSIHMNGH